MMESRYNTKGAGDDWTRVEYVFPPKDGPLTHQWLDEDGSGHFDGLRFMIEATGDNCTSARFDDFCVCRTTYEQGIARCCDPGGGDTSLGMHDATVRCDRKKSPLTSAYVGKFLQYAWRLCTVVWRVCSAKRMRPAHSKTSTDIALSFAMCAWCAHTGWTSTDGQGCYNEALGYPPTFTSSYSVGGCNAATPTPTVEETCCHNTV